ncbi:MAG: beta-lactamase family protein [Asgard group archaeon]|nr:beta-lactamase family protein [Asgard group archaeon]
MCIVIFLSSFLIFSIPNTYSSSEDTNNFLDNYNISDNPKIKQIPFSLVDLEDFCNGYILDQLDENDIGGMSISVVKDGELFFTRGYGYYDRWLLEPVDPNRTLFRIGSISKTFNAIAVLQLVEDGILDLDTDVNEYLTEFKIPDTYPEAITLRHLLTHSAGFEESRFAVVLDSPTYLEPLEEILKNGIPERVRPVGELTAYSNYGTALAGYIVQLKSGKDFAQYIKDEIFTPLGMNKSSFEQPLPSGLDDAMSRGFDENKIPGFFEYITVIPAGAGSSTAVDMAKLMLALMNNGTYNGARILENETMQLMQEDHFIAHPNLPNVNLGLYELDINNKHIISHGGDTIFFHSYMFMFPEENLGVFVSYNSVNGVIASRAFFSTFVNRYFPFPGRTVTPMIGYNKGLRNFAGFYVPARRYYSDTEHIREYDFLETGYEISISRGKLKLSMLNSIDFIQIEPNYFVESTGQYDFRLAFINDSKGDITHHYMNFSPTVVASEKVHPLYEKSEGLSVTIAVIGAYIFMSLIFWAITGFTNRKRKEEKAPTILRVAKWTVAGVFILTTLIYSLFLTYSLSTILLDTEQLIYSQGWLVASIIDIILTVGLIVFTGLSWLGLGKVENKPYWSTWGKINYSIMATLCIVFTWSFGYWNLLGI